jgi:hypothetical protein
MATKPAKRNTRRARTQSRTKQVVKLIQKTADFDTLDVVKMFVPETKFNHLSAEAKNEVIKLGTGLIDVVRAGQYDLRRAMR